VGPRVGRAPSADSLAEFFRVDVRCDPRDSVRLAAKARAFFARDPASADDAPEDLAVRLQDARAFGLFAEPLLRDRRLRAATRRALADRVFDLLPIAPAESEVFLVDARAPPHLLAFAAHLAAREAFFELHLLHLVYAVFLDRALVTRVPKPTRSSVLACSAGFAPSAPTPALLYATLHLAAVPAGEAVAEMRRILRSVDIPSPFKRSLAAIAAQDDGGAAAWLRLAQREGLLPQDMAVESAGALANVPRQHRSVTRATRAWSDG